MYNILSSVTFTFVDTSRKPPRIVAIKEEVSATIEDSVTLECLADGNPIPTVTWMTGNKFDNRIYAVNPDHRP